MKLLHLWSPCQKKAVGLRSDLSPPGRWRSFPPKWKRTSPRSRLVTPAWLQSPEHLRRPGDFRSYCHAPASLWPLERSTDSLDLTHNRPSLGARLFQTSALPTHFKGDAVTANCLLPSARSAFRSLAVPPFLACSRQQSVRRAGLIPPSLPREVQ